LLLKAEYSISETPREKRDVENIPAVFGFLNSQQVKKQGRLMPLIQCFCHLNIPWTESTASASMSKDDPPKGRRWNPEDSGEPRSRFWIINGDVQDFYFVFRYGIIHLWQSKQ
jgi:hypothetical protein